MAQETGGAAPPLPRGWFEACSPTGEPYYYRVDGGQYRPPSVYVGNINTPTVTWQILKDHMKQAGEVVRADVCAHPYPYGYGIVSFATPKDAKAAISALNDSGARVAPCLYPPVPHARHCLPPRARGQDYRCPS